MQGPADGHDDGWFDDELGGEHDDLPPLPPLGGERTWVHPSEVGMDQRGRTDRRRGKVLAGGLVVGGVGLLLFGVIMGLGWGTDDAPRSEATTADAYSPTLAALTVRSSTGSSTATGIVLDGEGHIAVRASAIAGGDELWASCAGRPPERAIVVATDEQADVAVVHVATESGRAVVDGDRPRDGQSVIVVRAGSGEEEPTSWTSDVLASGLHLVREDGSVTEALFSTAMAGSSGAGGSSTTSAIATSVSSTVLTAARTAGDGVVFDGRGRFLGLVVGGDRSAQLVLPASSVSAVADQLLTTGRVERPWLGLTTTDVPTDAGHPRGGGARVTGVEAGSPAAAAGLRTGDVVVAIGDATVSRRVDLVVAVQRLDVGATTQITVVRDGRRQTLSVTTADAR
jgi:putative serine protease PepD